MNPEKGAIQSLVDKETGQELVDQQAAWGFGQCLYETMPGNREMKPEVFKRSTLRNVKFAPGANGPVWKSLVLTASMDGCASNNGVRAELRLYETEKRVELHFAIRKLPIRTPESVYVALPFHAPDSQMFYEAQGGLVSPGKDQIPGSSSDWQTLQSFITLRGPQGQIITGSEQAPLVQLGGFNLGKWQRETRVEKPHVYSWIMNNYWFTNFRAEQEGEFKWHYYLTSTRDTSRTFATRFGWGSRVPFATRVFLPVKNQVKREALAISTLRIKVPNVLVVEARPARGGKGIFLHLREVEGQPATLTQDNLETLPELQGADEVNVLEETLQEGITSLSLKPFEVKFVRLMF